MTDPQSNPGDRVSVLDRDGEVISAEHPHTTWVHLDGDTMSTPHPSNRVKPAGSNR